VTLGPQGVVGGSLEELYIRAELTVQLEVDLPAETAPPVEAGGRLLAKPILMACFGVSCSMT
jgi:hypothetical protein